MTCDELMTGNIQNLYSSHTNPPTSHGSNPCSVPRKSFQLCMYSYSNFTQIFGLVLNWFMTIYNIWQRNTCRLLYCTTQYLYIQTYTTVQYTYNVLYKTDVMSSKGHCFIFINVIQRYAVGLGKRSADILEADSAGWRVCCKYKICKHWKYL